MKKNQQLGELPPGPGKGWRQISRDLTKRLATRFPQGNFSHFRRNTKTTK